MRKKIGIIFTIIIALLSTSKVYAFCPICTIAVGAGVGLSRYFGIDDTITGLWIGGLIVSLIMWTINWLDKKNWRFKGRNWITAISYYLAITLPLYFTNIIGHPLNRLWGADRLLLGMILGSVFFFAGGMWYQYLKKRNDGRAYFPFQKVAMPIAPLIILSILFYFITK